MTEIKTAKQLIQLFNPEDLDAIRTLFQGNLVDLETFARTVQTFIPKAYTATETMIDSIALAIVDLFEELDSDADGRVTWQDFMSYYSEASGDNKVMVREFPKTKSIFKQICDQTTQQSGKIAKVDIQSVLPNNAEFSEIKGTSIIQVHVFNQQYFIVTEQGIYSSDSSFLFPKLIFEPTPEMLQGSEREQKAKMLDKKTKMKKKNAAIQELLKQGILPPNTTIQIHDDEIKDDFELTTRDEILKHMASHPISQKSVIMHTLILTPLPYLVITTRLPLFIVVSLQGTQATSDPFRLPAAATSLYWQEENNLLYIGLENGAISCYQLRMQPKQHQFLEMMNQDNKLISQSDSLTQLKEALKTKTFDQLTLEDLCRIYPEMRRMVGSQLTEYRQNKKEEVDQLMKLRSFHLFIPELMTKKIFNPHQSTLEQHGIKPLDLVKEDPKAFIKARMLPGPKQTAIFEKKHGGVQLQVDAELIVSDYIVNGSVKKICGGFGQFENLTSGTEVFRLVVAGGDGSVTIVDQDLNHVCSFSELHEEGIVTVYCIKDYITSIGYNNIYQIDASAIQQAYLGKCVRPEEEPNLQTTEPGQSINRSNTIIDTSVSKLMKGDKLKTQHAIRFIDPPRPGKPVLATFIMGNIICVIDHDYMITMFHAVTGAHLTRTTFSIGQLQGLRFGQCTYNFNKDQALIPIGKYMFFIKAISNEQVGQSGEVWGYLQDVHKEEQKSHGVSLDQIEENNQLLTRIPIGSISTEINNVMINKNLNEVAIITGDYEITFYDLKNGQVKKVINIESLSRQLSDDDLFEQPMTEYASVESTDIATQFSEKSVMIERENMCYIQNDKRKREAHEIDAQQLLQIKRPHKSGLPSFVTPIERMKQQEKAKVNLIRILGDQILSLQMDRKGRVLFIIGTKNILTLYWQTGCLFDYTCVGIVGRKDDENNDILNEMENPFKRLDANSSLLQGNTRIENKQITGGITSYSLGLDLNQFIVRDKKLTFSIKNKTVNRWQRLTMDYSRRLLFLADSLNQQECKVVTMSPNEEFISAPTNSRVLTNLNVVECIAEMDPMFQIKQKFWTKYNEKNTFQGLYDGASKYSRTFRYVPQLLENADKINELKDKHKSNLAIILQSLMDSQICIELSNTSIITCLDCSEMLGLLAIGCSDNRVLIFDTQSVKFMKQGYVSIPVYRETASITTVKFLGQYPLLFVGLNDGSCIIYTTRPLSPAYVIVLFFKHSSYSPIAYPSNIDLISQVLGYERHLDRFLMYFSDEARHTTKYNTVENDFIKMVYQDNLPDSKNLFINQHSDFTNRQLIETAFKINYNQIHHEDVNLSQASSAASTRSSRPFSAIVPTTSQVNKLSMSQLSALTQYTVETTKRGVVNFPTLSSGSQIFGRKDSISTVNDTIYTGKNRPLSAASSFNYQSTAQLAALQEQKKKQQQEKDEMLVLYDHYKLVFQEIFASINQTGNNVMSSGGYAKTGKQRKIIAKIQGAVTVLTLTKNVLFDFIATKNQLKVNRDISREIFKKVDVEEDVDIFIRSKLPISDKIKRDYSVSKKTLKIIEDFKKSRFNVKQVKQREIDMFMDFSQLSEYDLADMEAENLGVVYKYIPTESGTIKVPMRQIALETARCNIAVSSCYFDQDRRQLLVGDQQGYITCYDLREFFQKNGITPVEIKKKTLFDEKTKSYHEHVLGFAEQGIDVRLLKSVENPRIQPLFNSKIIAIVYQFRAHSEAVQSIEPLPSNNYGQFITVGEDRRFLLWDLITGALLGSCQRVKLDHPPQYWEQLFVKPLEQNQTLVSQIQSLNDSRKKKLTAQMQSLQINDLDNIPLVHKQLPPPLRVEQPPPAEYPWNYKAQQLFSQKGETLSSSAVSFQKDGNVVQLTKGVLTKRNIVPTLDYNQASNLLKSTGLNPDIMSKYQSSWTVGAALQKASRGQLNGQEEDVMEQLAQSYRHIKINGFEDDQNDLGIDSNLGTE